MKFKSLWKGPEVGDNVESAEGGISASPTWLSVGLYALDDEDCAWTYCIRVLGLPRGKWIRFDDLMSGAAGREVA